MTDENTLGSVAIVVHGAFHDQGRGQCGVVRPVVLIGGPRHTVFLL
jgi:hypothetical protein